MVSWRQLSGPEDGEWRVPETFRDRSLTLAQLDCWVGEFGQGCLAGRADFVKFISKCVVGGHEWWAEVKRQEQERQQRLDLQLEREVAYRRDRYYERFEDGWEPSRGLACSNYQDCAAEDCIALKLYEEWVEL